MKIDITGRHVSVTEALKSYVTQRIEKLDRHFDGIQSVHVMLDVEGDHQVAEIVVTCSRGATLVGTAKMEDMYAAIDQAVDRVLRQTTRHKERLKDHHRYKKSVEES